MENEIHHLPTLIDQVQHAAAYIIYFYSDRCAPCVTLRPKIQKMTDEEFPKITLSFVNSEYHPDIAAHYGVFANPAIIVFFEGREYRRYSKYISVGQLSGEIERVYRMLF
ncbi:MAG: thioredoxin family protein [Bacteroidales bacterium]|jgi:thioredoxin-like negative regulator of GroEL|nr:thioredoxin family protein [Bacteroidales bacterium]NCU36750.1 thioredoxin [Candidatus Falkowbacteria bacterium]MDD2632241.1 thioredoxin family protein [Bacteroidales bacterium]MDD4176116.1 thioredoxin family protein [Bacteroidales bacterium]MDD4740597.1 thioredoxin family protein [Bacteroidales bacterium]